MDLSVYCAILFILMQALLYGILWQICDTLHVLNVPSLVEEIEE